MIHRAKENIRNSKKKFPHEENKFSITHYKYPPICQFTKTFLEYSAEDIFYTAIGCIEVLSKGKLVNVKLRTLTKFNYYKLYKKSMIMLVIFVKLIMFVNHIQQQHKPNFQKTAKQVIFSVCIER